MPTSNFNPVERIKSKRPPIHEDWLETETQRKNKEKARRKSRKFKQDNRYEVEDTE